MGGLYFALAQSEGLRLYLQLRGSLLFASNAFNYPLSKCNFMSKNNPISNSIPLCTENLIIDIRICEVSLEYIYELR